jgi:hypothetical protein
MGVIILSEAIFAMQMAIKASQTHVRELKDLPERHAFMVIGSF